MVLKYHLIDLWNMCIGCVYLYDINGYSKFGGHCRMLSCGVLDVELEIKNVFFF